MCFTCWLRSGFSHFIYMDSLSFTWYLAAAESRISKQFGLQDAIQNSELCRCLKPFQDLSESKCSFKHLQSSEFREQVIEANFDCGLAFIGSQN